MGRVTLKGVGIAFGGPVLLDGADLHIEAGERICLIGRNGTGKSTLLKLIHGELEPDRGRVVRDRGVTTALLAQEVPLDLAGTVYDVVASGREGSASLLREHDRLARDLERGDDADSLESLSEIQHAMEAAGAWSLHDQVRNVVSRMGLDASARCSDLSAGLKRRVHLARALVRDPDVLLLDEPTNHLDIDAIEWMEDFLLRFGGTMLFVTHDRAFLKRLATRIVELDRGKLVSFPGDYEAYLVRKEALLETEAARNEAVDRRLAGEEAWVRRGLKARRTRNEGRVRALEQLRDQVAGRQLRSGNVRLLLQEAERSGRLVIDAREVSFAYGPEPILEGFSATLLRGDKVGVIGANGCGKTTLLRILLGEIAPDAGTVRWGTRLEVAYFDQLRAQLDETRTLEENVADGADTVLVNGKPRNVMGYLKDFLFTPAQARAPITALSGGERNRLLLARLFTRPSNVLVLDEPTNDLDPETLELLEAMLIEYAGTVLMVSHDRAFLNNVASSTLVFEGRGRVRAYVGGYDDWLRQRAPASEKPLSAEQPKKARRRPDASGVRKLTYKEQRELERLPDLIEEMEARKSGLFETLGDPSLYRGGGAGIARHRADLAALERELEKAYARWEQLEAQAK